LLLHILFAPLLAYNVNMILLAISQEMLMYFVCFMDFQPIRANFCRCSVKLAFHGMRTYVCSLMWWWRPRSGLWLLQRLCSPVTYFHLVHGCCSTYSVAYMYIYAHFQYMYTYIYIYYNIYYVYLHLKTPLKSLQTSNPIMVPYIIPQVLSESFPGLVPIFPPLYIYIYIYIYRDIYIYICIVPYIDVAC